MRGVTISIEHAQGKDAIAEFVALHDRVYAARAVRWQSSPLHLPMLLGMTPATIGRELRPLVARDGGEVVARVCAVVDGPYLAHWNEQVGHLLLFEAQPSARDAVRQLLDAACAWLAERGMEAARIGFGLLETPFTTDDYDALPPSTLRQNPREYHALIKGAGFETERGFVDYAMPASPALVERWQSSLESARRAGFELVRFRDVPHAQRGRQLCELWNATFASHWGWCPLSPEITSLFVLDGQPVLDTSTFALADGEPVGFCFVLPDDASHVDRAPGRELRPGEVTNALAIGVLPPARGRGLNYAMAAHGFLELVRRGWTHVSYTLVLDDNWPSRRTGEGLGGSLRANYAAYRRHFARR
jgi:GNAT superfamily N-acetyltransferase